jgi:DNA-binding beta-propeller fold protein YncE
MRAAVSSVDTAPPRSSPLFEVPGVRPIAVSSNGLVAVTNTPDDRLELFKSGRNGLSRCGSVSVGLRPVSAVFVGDDLWVVNHLSDSVSVVSVNRGNCTATVTRTLNVGDEPRDIVTTRKNGRSFVFVTTAHRGQNVTTTGGAYRDPELTTPSVGRADVFVFDPAALGRVGEEKPLDIIELYADTPRALAVGDGKVYAAGFMSGNQTAVVRYNFVVDRGRKSLALLDRNDDLVLDADLPEEQRVIEGGYPAVRGTGRCISALTTTPPSQSSNDFIMDVCVKTDPANPRRAVALVPQIAGQVTPDCSCTNGIGELQRTPPLIVRFYESTAVCGTNFDTTLGGCWLEPPQGNGDDAIPRAQQWNAFVPFTLADKDVFTIDTSGARPTLEPSGTFRHVGTTLFGMAVHPKSGAVFVGNTEARNHVRFEGPGAGKNQAEGHGSTTVRGHIAESRISLLDPASRGVATVHLNPHIDYSNCCAPVPNAESERSLAFPTALAISRYTDNRGRVKDNQDLYVAALGSDKVAVIPTRVLDGTSTDRAVQNASTQIEVSGGPVGLTLAPDGASLYVYTHLTNELVVVDTSRRRVAQRHALLTPEPASVREGRRFLYDARRTSSHGDSACASCHIFGDFDGLAWDLGDPNSVEEKNPGPFFSQPEILSSPLTSHFLALKGPMTTQSLRGMANHGAMHWRGDRRGGPESEQPDDGAFDEEAAFTAFNVAFPGLNGRSAQLSAGDMRKFTKFALQLTYPPNPIRALDDSLDAAQQRARSRYFGCDITDESMALGECADGRNIEEETLGCNCLNPPEFVLGIKPRPDYCPPDPKCTLDVSDFQNTCHGCHTLNPDGNREFGVDKPGFFGSDGRYTNDAVAHILKIPHLRNAYQKVGMFGSYKTPQGVGLTSITDSILGARKGGLLAPQNAHLGEQLRGFGFTHAGEEDTLFHFFSLTGFVRSPSPGIAFPNDNRGGFEVVFPLDPNTCFDSQLPSLNAAFLAQLAPPAQLQQLGLWLATLLNPASTEAEKAEAFQRLATFIATLPPTNPGSVFQRLPIQSAVGQLSLPLLACNSLPGGAVLTALGCFDLEPNPSCAPLLDTVKGCSLWGATLEEIMGSPTRACQAAGIRDKADMESLVFAFDSNLKPVVGQQVTLSRGCGSPPNARLELLREQADAGNCNLVANDGRRAYVYEQGKMRGSDGRRITIAELISRSGSVTFTAVPPGESSAALAADDLRLAADAAAQSASLLEN